MTSNPNNNFDNTTSSTAAGGAIPTNRFEQAGAGGTAAGYPGHNITIHLPHPGAMPQTQAGAGAPPQGGQNFGTTGYTGQPGQNQPDFSTTAGQTGFNHSASQPPFDPNMGGAGQQQYPQSFAPAGQQFGSSQMAGTGAGTGPRGIDFQDAPTGGVGSGAAGAMGGAAMSGDGAAARATGQGTGAGSNWNTGSTLSKHHHHNVPGEKRGDAFGSNPLNVQPVPEGGFAVGGQEGLPMGRANAADKLIGKFEQEAGKLTGDYSMQVTGELRAAGGKAAVRGEARAPHPKDL